MFNKLYGKLFLSPYFFKIALCKRENDSILDRKNFVIDKVIPGTYKNWAADPILVENEGKTYMFYEAVVKDKGHIEVVEVYDDCSVSKATVVIKDNCHYSYPFVFKHSDCWYMIPESSEANEVRLYKAVCFPYEWKCEAVLLKGKFVDTTVFENNGELILLTFIPTPLNEKVEPRAYKLHLDDQRCGVEPIEWHSYNALQVRGAGPIIVEKDGVYRPSQINCENSYGEGLSFNKIDISQSVFSENVCCEIFPENIVTTHKNISGLHTYTRTNKFEAIDIRCREFDLFKIIKYVLKIN